MLRGDSLQPSDRSSVLVRDIVSPLPPLRIIRKFYLPPMGLYSYGIGRSLNRDVSQIAPIRADIPCRPLPLVQSTLLDSTLVPADIRILVCIYLFQLDDRDRSIPLGLQHRPR